MSRGRADIGLMLEIRCYYGMSWKQQASKKEIPFSLNNTQTFLRSNSSLNIKVCIDRNYSHLLTVHIWNSTNGCSICGEGETISLDTPFSSVQSLKICYITLRNDLHGIRNGTERTSITNYLLDCRNTLICKMTT